MSLNNNALLVGSGIGGGGFLLVYLAQKLYNNYFSSKNNNTLSNNNNRKKDNTSTTQVEQEYNLSTLMNEIFPFHFLPDNSPTMMMKNSTPSSSPNNNIVEMKLNDKKKLNQFINLLRDYNTCKQAIFKEMLFHKIARIIKETTTIETLEHVNSKEFYKREKEIHTCLWILLHCLVLIGNDSIDVLLSIFRLDDFYQFFIEKDYTKHQAMKIFNFMNQNDSIFNASESFLFSIDIVWLSFAILGHLYCQSLNSYEKINFKFSHHHKKYLEILQINKEMFEQLLFLSPTTIDNNNSTTTTKEGDGGNNTERYKRNILFTTENQIGYDNLMKFLNITNLLMWCDDNTLVQLSLSIFGQLIANVKDENVILKNLNFVKNIEHLLLCTDENIIIALGKCIFTLFMKNVTIISTIINNHPKILNEIIYWSLNSQQSSTRIQYMNILYILILQNEKFTIQLVTNSKINLLGNIHHLITTSRSDSMLEFVLIQLLYGISTHPSCHKFIIEFHNEKFNFITILKNLTFSKHSLIRYYCIMIWSNLLTMYNNTNNNNNRNHEQINYDKINDNRFTRYLCKNEQILNLVMFSFKEEKELLLKKSITNLLKDICSFRQNDYERIILFDHFNLLFESVDLLHFQVNYLMDVYQNRDGQLMMESSENETVEASLQLSISLFHLITTIVRMSGSSTDSTSNSSGDTNNKNETLDILLNQYQIKRYITDLLFILQKRGDDKNITIISTLSNSIFKLS